MIESHKKAIQKKELMFVIGRPQWPDTWPSAFEVPEETQLRSDYDNISDWSMHELMLSLNRTTALISQLETAGLPVPTSMWKTVELVASAILDLDDRSTTDNGGPPDVQ